MPRKSSPGPSAPEAFSGSFASDSGGAAENGVRTFDLPFDGRAFAVAYRALQALARLEMVVMIVALTGVTLLTGISVVMRDLFAVSLVWAQEISLLMFHVLVFTGAGLVYKSRAYITMDFVFRSMPPSVRHWLMCATWILATLFPLVVLWQGLGLYSRQITTFTYILELPRFYFTAPLLYGAASLLATNAFYAWASVSFVLGRPAPDALPRFEAATAIVHGMRSER